MSAPWGQLDPCLLFLVFVALHEHFYHPLCVLNLDAGREYDKPASKSKIPGFISTFNLDMDEAQVPSQNIYHAFQPSIFASPDTSIVVQLKANEFETFNDFFARKLKPAARPIAFPSDPNVVVQVQWPLSCPLFNTA
jgi:phosphatidylserine decarboxylase